MGKVENRIPRITCIDQGNVCETISSNQLHFEYVSLVFYFFSLHEVCLIENTERRKWYRAFCADPDVHQIDCNALMVLLDYDEVLQIPYSRIWKLPPALAFPVLSIDCFIRGECLYIYI